MILPDDLDDNLRAFFESIGDNEFVAVDQVMIAYSYIDRDGDPAWAYHVRGDERLAPLLGLIEIVKAYLLAPPIAGGLQQLRTEENEP